MVNQSSVNRLRDKPDIGCCYHREQYHDRGTDRDCRVSDTATQFMGRFIQQHMDTDSDLHRHRASLGFNFDRDFCHLGSVISRPDHRRHRRTEWCTYYSIRHWHWLYRNLYVEHEHELCIHNRERCGADQWDFYDSDLPLPMSQLHRRNWPHLHCGYLWRQ